MDDELFAPCEPDEHTGKRISAKSLGPWGDQAVIDPAWEALDRARTPQQFYRAAAALVFHARHLTPVEHATLAERLRTPFKLVRGGQENWERTEEIIYALGSTGRIAWHEWHNMSRQQMIAEIQAKWGLTEDAARKAYDKARRIKHERDAERARERAEGKWTG